MSEQSRILMVDDEPSTCWIVGKQLLLSGYDADCVYDASSALTKLNDESFDLLLIDLVMGDMSGLDLLRTIRAADNHIPAIILTAHESLESAIEATHLRVSDYVVKSPHFLQVLLDAVERALSEPPPR